MHFNLLTSQYLFDGIFLQWTLEIFVIEMLTQFLSQNFGRIFRFGVIVFVLFGARAGARTWGSGFCFARFALRFAWFAHSDEMLPETIFVWDSLNSLVWQVAACMYWRAHCEHDAVLTFDNLLQNSDKKTVDSKFKTNEIKLKKILLHNNLYFPCELI